jgi:hypothetical protein
MTKKDTDKRDQSYGQLWKMRTIFDKLNDSCAKYYSPTEHSTGDEITVLFKAGSFLNSIY